MLDFAKEQELPILRQIWKECFGDSDHYIDCYFDKLSDSITVPVFRQDGVPVSMLSMVPVELHFGGQVYAGHYIYAAATAKAAEGKGYMSALLEYSCDLADRRGDRFSCLIPGTPSLFDFYAKRGYRAVSHKNMKFYSSLNLPPAQKGSGIPLTTDLSEPSFWKHRQAFLEKQPGVILPEKTLYSYFYLEMKSTGAEMIGIGETDYLVCYPEKGLLNVKETSLSEKALVQLLPFLLKRSGCTEAVVSFPATDSTLSHHRKPYGMLRPLSAFPDSCKGKPFYMGLMMD